MGSRFKTSSEQGDNRASDNVVDFDRHIVLYGEVEIDDPARAARIVKASRVAGLAASGDPGWPDEGGSKGLMAPDASLDPPGESTSRQGWPRIVPRETGSRVDVRTRI